MQNRVDLKKFILLLAVALLLAGCGTFPFISGEVRLSADELNRKMQRRFPLDKSVAGLLDVTLSSPRIDLSEADNRISTHFLLSVRLPLSGKSVTGSMKVSGRPEYVATTRALYLRDARIEQIRMDSMPDALSAALAKAATSIAREVLEGKPLHNFIAEDFTRYGIQYEPERIFVRGDLLVLALRR